MLWAQSAPAPVIDLKPETTDLWEHRLGPVTAIHLTAEEYRPLQPGLAAVEMSVVVSANGRVESAQVTGRITVHADEARSIEMERLFEPWIIDGAAARVRLTDFVSLLPPEEWAAVRVPFPQRWDLRGASVTLTRTSCYGACPAYELTIGGDGSIHFHGHPDALIPGDHLAHVDPSVVRGLIVDFQKADFLSAKDEYHAPWTDNPTQTLALTLNGRTKKVVDYLGTEAGLPLAIFNLEAEVDETADSARWVKGDESTVPSLDAEHWAFSTGTRQNLMLYDAILRAGNQPLLRRFLTARAPVTAPPGMMSDDSANGERVASPVCVASGKGDLELVERLLDSQRTSAHPVTKAVILPQRVLNECLFMGARCGSADVVAYWLDHGADAKAQPEDRTVFAGWGALANGIESGNPEVVEMLLDHDADVHTVIGEEPLLTYAVQRAGKETAAIVSLLIEAGADVNARNSVGQTPLFAAGFAPEAVKPLLAAGANVNARDQNGSTPLINAAFIEPMVRELLANGADPTATNNRGDTALKLAHQDGCEPCAVVIEAAMKKHGAPETISVLP